MSQQRHDGRAVWLTMGVLGGLAIAAYWPHEQVRAVSTDRDAQFAMATCQVGAIAAQEAIFVLDFLTGSLKGGVLSQNGTFSTFYYRDLPKDFGLDPKKEAHYCIVTGLATLSTQSSNVPPAPSVVYIGELTTGKIVAYGFGYREGSRTATPVALTPIAQFPFREPEPRE